MFVRQAGFSLLDLFFNQMLYLLYVSGKNSADSILKMRAVQWESYWRWEEGEKMNFRNKMHSCYSKRDQGLVVSLFVAPSDAICSKTKWEKQTEAQIWKIICPKVPARQWKNPQLPMSPGCGCLIDQILQLKLPARILILFQPWEAVTSRILPVPFVAALDRVGFVTDRPDCGGNCQTLRITDRRSKSQSRAGD